MLSESHVKHVVFSVLAQVVQDSIVCFEHHVVVWTHELGESKSTSIAKLLEALFGTQILGEFVLIIDFCLNIKVVRVQVLPHIVLGEVIQITVICSKSLEVMDIVLITENVEAKILSSKLVHLSQVDV